jgi:tetratricopeptide (TPR) repeat protein
MPPARSALVDRFKRLPRRPNDVWQGGMVRAPTLIDEPDGGVRRPWAAVWVSVATGMTNVELAETDDASDWRLALRVLADLGVKFVKGRPGGLEVADPALGVWLAEALDDPELAVSMRDDLPEVDRVMREMERGMAGDAPPIPDALEAPGVTVERMREFADAARKFYEAAPWQHLSDEDLVHVEAPGVGVGLEYFTVLGAAGEAFGLGFFRNRQEFDAVHEGADPAELVSRAGKWTVLYGAIDEMPFGDADLWRRADLAVAGPSAYPVAMWYGPGGQLRRPRADELASLTAILQALAHTTEAEIDRGRWSRDVRGHDGQQTVTLAIPELLAPLDTTPPRRTGPLDRRAMEHLSTEIERFMQGSLFESLEEANAALRERFSGPIDDAPSTATTPLEKAQDLIYRAFEARGRRRIQLARKALELSADCADAYVVLAEQSRDPEAARTLYQQGVAAGERALGADVFAQEAGRFWGIVGTRPYMRARFGLAQSVAALGRHDDAIEHYRELIRLNPNDNQGVRYSLLAALLLAKRDEEARTLIEQFGDEPTAMWRYGRALTVFRREGDSRAARECLRAALRTNRHAPSFLCDDADWPGPEPSTYAPGSREEAAICDTELGEAWRATPEAIRWLRAQTPVRRSGKRRRR